jgi:undecaprenyl-diphosphatase
MNIVQALILGTVQGLTEFLPISSSGHLVFIPKLFGWVDQGLVFDVVLHMGTLLAVVFYFRKTLISLILGRDFTSSYRKKLILFLFISVVPAGLAGFLLGDWIELNTRATWIVGASLIFWGIFLASADGFSKGLAEKKASCTIDGLTWKNIFFISCAQAVALIPGTSRSGITITAGLFSKLDKKSATEFSFLMSIPVIALAGGYKLMSVLNNGISIEKYDILVIGFFASLVSGFFAIKFLIKIIEKWSFMPFVAYRVTIGILILLFL